MTEVNQAQMWPLLDRLQELTSGFKLWSAGNSISLDVSVPVRPKPGLTHDGYESKTFKASTVGQGHRDCFTPLFERAIKWAEETRDKVIE